MADMNNPNAEGIGDEGNNQQQNTLPGNVAWKQGMKADIRDNEFFSEMENITALGERAIAMNDQLKNAVIRPGENATDQEKKNYFTSLGRPESAEGYEFSPVPEGLQEDENLKTWFRNEAFDRGLSKDDAAKFYDSWNNYVAESVNKLQSQQQELRASAEAELKKEWGTEYDQRYKRSQTAIKKWGGEGFFDMEDPTVIRFVDNFVKLISEDELGSGGEGGNIAPSREKGVLNFSKSFPDKK